MIKFWIHFPCWNKQDSTQSPYQEWLILKSTRKSVQKTYPSRLLIQESPHPIGNRGRVPHSPSRCIEGTIPRSRIDDPMTKKLIQHPLISGQLLPLWAQLGVKPPQRHQSLVPDDVVQRASRRPRRTGSPLIGMIGRRDNLQEWLDSLPRRERPHLPAAESNTRRGHHYTSPKVVVQPGLPRHGCRSRTCGH